MKPLVLTGEQDARAANLVSSYGLGTRSYNRSSEKREMDRQRKQATEKHLAQPRHEREAPLLCRCLSWEFPHELEAHKQLSSDYDWPTPGERLARHREFWERGL